MNRPIYCTGCRRDVQARLTSGKEIYPHRPDLYSLPFWMCDGCSNHVGCHYKTTDRTRPLGNIPTPEIRKLRIQIHAAMDPMWQAGKGERRKVYALLSDALGHEYHTAELSSVDECRKVLRLLDSMNANVASRDCQPQESGK